MTYFIDVRADSAGGNPVASVDAIFVRSDAQPTPSRTLEPDLLKAVQGRDVLLGTHGFHVTRSNGIDYLNHWNEWLNLGPNGIFVGVLWPGDSRWVPFIDYPVEGDEAITSGHLLAEYLTAKFAGANSLSFCSHSLGARVILETIQDYSGSLAMNSVTIMAGAIDDTCLNGEYQKAAGRVGRISVLASDCDDVLKLAFPAGNFLSGIITRQDPYWHGALGRYGPNPGDLPAKLWKSPILPDSLDFGHGSYINCSGAVTGPPNESGPFFPPALAVPGPGAAKPNPERSNWQQAWAAGFVSTRF